MSDSPAWFSKDLVLGWKVTKSLDPLHWDTDGKLGEHKLSHVVAAVPKSIAHHTIIVAQSGSGKSFFLGRVVEEILLKTRSRVLILDMNSDFRKISHVKSADNWAGSCYDRTKRAGFLAEEPSQAEFVPRWDQISKTLYSARSNGGDAYEELRLNWLKFPVDLLAEDADDSMRDNLRHCHNLINILAGLANAQCPSKWLEEGQFLTRAEHFCEETREADEQHIVEKLGKEFGPGSGRVTAVKMSASLVSGHTNFAYLPREIPSLAGMFSQVSSNELYHRAATHRRFVTDEAIRFYFARAAELEHSGLISPDFREALRERSPNRLEVVDIPSIRDPRHQKMAICTFLEVEWQRALRNWEQALDGQPDADERVPLFIVVEEAHNAMPAKPHSAVEVKLQEQFRRIAAEGRKFGLFLILVSQRPDKLDETVMSECENRAIMKVGSNFVLRTTCEVLGLDDLVPKMTEKALEFDVGRALLAGPWVLDEPTFLVSAARRTEEGGRDLRASYWAQLPEGT